MGRFCLAGSTAAKIGRMRFNLRSAPTTQDMRPGRPICGVLAMLLAALIAAPGASAQVKPPLAQLLEGTGIPPGDVSLDDHMQASPTRGQQLPFFRSVMARPLDAAYRAGVLAHAYGQSSSSPHELIGLTGAAAGTRVQRSAESVLGPLEIALRGASDPLAASLAMMGPVAKAGSAWPPALPDSTALPNPAKRWPPHRWPPGPPRQRSLCHGGARGRSVQRRAGIWRSLGHGAGAGLDGEWPMPFPIRPLTAEVGR